MSFNGFQEALGFVLLWLRAFEMFQETFWWLIVDWYPKNVNLVKGEEHKIIYCPSIQACHFGCVQSELISEAGQTSSDAIGS